MFKYCKPFQVSGLLLLLALAACSGNVDPVSGPDGGADKRAIDPATVIINGYAVSYGGRTFDGEQTTFTWNVVGTDTPPPLSYFLVELPPCAPAPSGWEPAEGHVYTHPTLGVTGMKWVLRIDPDDYTGRSYTLTFPGEVAEGTVAALVNAGMTTAAGEIPGPCAGVALEEFTLAGEVFIDTDGDGVRGPFEAGLEDVVVELAGPDQTVETFVTGADGAWHFLRTAGTWTVRVDTLGHADHLNAELRAYWDATTPLEAELVVGPDSFGTGFGFNPFGDRLAEDLENDTLVTDGESTDWWKQQLLVMIILQERNFDPYPDWIRETYYAPERILGFIETIEGLFLVDPFVFTEGDEFRSAYGQLRRLPQTDVQELRRELLTTEFNLASGRGIAGVNPVLLSSLVAWGESLVAAAEADGLKGAKADIDLVGATRIFRGINTGGGGGIDE